MVFNDLFSVFSTIFPSFTWFKNIWKILWNPNFRRMVSPMSCLLLNMLRLCSWKNILEKKTWITITLFYKHKTRAHDRNHIYQYTSLSKIALWAISTNRYLVLLPRGKILQAQKGWIWRVYEATNFSGSTQRSIIDFCSRMNLQAYTKRIVSFSPPVWRRADFFSLHILLSQESDQCVVRACFCLPHPGPD